MKLHLGCGKRYIPGFVHVDSVKFPHVDHVGDIRTLNMIDEGAAELIYACQVLEYFDREEVGAVLAEWKRVLQPGGILRLSVPNFATLATLYGAGFSLDYMLGTLYGKIPQSNGGYIYHRTTYDEPSLVRVLTTAGFVSPEHWNWRTAEHANVDDFSQAYFPHMDKEHGMLFNLNMQARKP